MFLIVQGLEGNGLTKKSFADWHGKHPRSLIRYFDLEVIPPTEFFEKSVAYFKEHNIPSTYEPLSLLVSQVENPETASEEALEPVELNFDVEAVAKAFNIDPLLLLKTIIKNKLSPSKYMVKTVIVRTNEKS